MENKIITQEQLLEKLSKSNDDGFKIALMFNSYFKSYRDITINNLKGSDTKDFDIGVIDYLGLLITKINQIQEKRDEG